MALVTGVSGSSTPTPASRGHAASFGSQQVIARYATVTTPPMTAAGAINAWDRTGPKAAYAFRSCWMQAPSWPSDRIGPSAPLDPLPAIKAAVTRQNTGRGHPDGWIPEQKITVEERPRLYTGSASQNSRRISRLNLGWQTRGPRDAGSRHFEIDPGQIDQAKAVLTMVGGEWFTKMTAFKLL